MKSICSLLLSISILASASAQKSYLDSLRSQLTLAKNEDTSRVLALFSLADYYGFLQFDSCLFYAAKTSELSQELNYPYGKFLGYMSTFHGLNSQGNYSKALEAALNIQKTAEELKNVRPWVMSQAYYFIGLLNREMSNYQEAKAQLQKSIQWQNEIGEPMEEVFASYSQMGILYANLKQLDSALFYARKGYDLGLHSKRYKIYFPLAIGALGNINVALGRYKQAGEYFREAIDKSRMNNNIYFQARNYNNLASLFDKTNVPDSCIYYAGISLQLSREHNFAEFTYDASRMLTKSYDAEARQDSTLKYLKIMLAAKDSVFSQSKVKEFQQSSFNEIQRQQEMNIAKERYQYKVQVYSMMAALGVFLLLVFILYQNNRQKQKAKINIEKAYEKLKSTQAQLIQSEKMASLGELTAGIAHEIQNPLNFVNNFSEVNSELIDELEQEADKGNLDEVKSIAKNIGENEKKISHHGKRADAIVKGMLQHTKSGSGKKESVNINALTDEYLRLAYLSLRGKDELFKAMIKTDYDDKIGNIKIIPQDIGRVLLNVYNNAFYAVAEKKKQQRENYEPAVSVSTKRTGDKVLISVRDNGNGIPQQILNKIFQPFFTTKPTGQGTGLGLSLSYDLIKSHGGELKVESLEGSYTEFVIWL